MERFHLGVGGMISYLCLPPLLSVPVSYFLPSCMVRCYLIFDDMFRSCFLISPIKQLGNSREQEKWKEFLTHVAGKCLFHFPTKWACEQEVKNCISIATHSLYICTADFQNHLWNCCAPLTAIPTLTTPPPLSSSPGKHRAILSWVLPVIKRLQMLRCWKSHFPGGGSLGGFPISRWFPAWSQVEVRCLLRQNSLDF